MIDFQGELVQVFEYRGTLAFKKKYIYIDFKAVGIRRSFDGLSMAGAEIDRLGRGHWDRGLGGSAVREGGAGIDQGGVSRMGDSRFDFE